MNAFIEKLREGRIRELNNSKEYKYEQDLSTAAELTKNVLSFQKSVSPLKYYM